MFETERRLLIIIKLEQQVQGRTVPEKLQSVLTLDMEHWASGAYSCGQGRIPRRKETLFGGRNPFENG